ncbi:MAG: methyltransferase domain-containing protein [Spirochaetales bacterium]|uniref:Methyltransferase domain-containing protein n=1 Tax=Candidatus Thalassospirochaeta sargassi TaxID=3119039 RepID=A0AAJ1II39_9SPIO|nr:methyltransferase domain-containing protein [Spirochaetales bacterium]
MFIDDHEEWFKNPEFWKIYKPLMFDPDRMEDTPLETGRIVELAGINPSSDILDLCCGEGRHMIELAKLGHRVTGVDITDPYLERGRKNAADAGVDVRFIKQDVRSFTEENRYDFAMNYFTSFGYFDDVEDDLIFCSNACRSLKSGGSFLIDTIGKETAALHFKETEWFQRDGYLIMLEYKITDGWTHIENRWMFVSDDHSEPAVLYETVFRHRLYSAIEMADLLNRAGFSEVRFFGALDGRPYDHRAERMLTLAVK